MPKLNRNALSAQMVRHADERRIAADNRVLSRTRGDSRRASGSVGLCLHSPDALFVRHFEYLWRVGSGSRDSGMKGGKC